MLVFSALRGLAFPRAVIALTALIAILPCHAQQTTGTILGTVVDSTGAAVSGVTVRVLNLATNARRETQTDVSGNYTLPSLPAGNYKVSATAQGFQVQQVESLTLQVEQ